MDSKVSQRAAADLNPPGVPNSFRRAKNQQNIACVLLRREFGGARRQKTVRAVGEDREENFWAEGESAFKVPPVCRCSAIETARSTIWRREATDESNGLFLALSCPLQHQSRYFELPQTTKSTISIAISPDG